jgi:hypothetical protein
MKLRTLNILVAFVLGFFSIASEASSQLTKLNVITTGVSPTSLPSVHRQGERHLCQERPRRPGRTRDFQYFGDGSDFRRVGNR